MKRKIKKRIPKLPHWRWLLFKAFREEDPDVDERILQLKRWLLENFDKEEILEQVDFRELEVYHKKGDEDIDQAKQVHDCLPIRFSVEKLLLERCEHETIQDVVYNKFHERLSKRSIAMYRKIFFDHDVLNKYDIASFYDEKGFNVDDIVPPVPAKWRDKYQVFQAGGDIDIEKDDILEHILYTALFRSEELQGMGLEGDKLSLRWQKRVLDAIDMMKDINQGDVSGVPDQFDIEVTYPEETAEDVGEIEGYDPVEDAGDMEGSPEEYEHSFDLDDEEVHDE